MDCSLISPSLFLDFKQEMIPCFNTINKKYVRFLRENNSRSKKRNYKTTASLPQGDNDLMERLFEAYLWRVYLNCKIGELLCCICVSVYK